MIVNNETNKTREKVGLMVGRFQPITKAHEKMINALYKDNDKAIVFMIKGKKSSLDKDKNPFGEKIQTDMLKAVNSDVKIEVLNSGFFVDFINKYENTDFVIYAGSDRANSYLHFEKYLKNGNTLVVKEIKRDENAISGTKVRESLKFKNKKLFEELTPAPIHKMYNTLSKVINEE